MRADTADFPTIEVTAPGEILTNSSFAVISIMVTDLTEFVSYEIISGSGQKEFDPENGIIDTSLGSGSANTTYLAPTTAGNYPYVVV